jgi:photosystem II stability/assembly factor-like uncharacterized protein
VLISSDTQAVANTAYGISSTSGGTVTLTLPASAGLAAGDFVSVTGMSATPWTIAQNAGQSILTSGLNGNVAPGTNWTQAFPTPQVWHWVSTNSTGQVIVAGEAPSGLIRTSSDGGATWTAGNATTGVWISSDMSASGDRIVAVQYGGGMYTSTDFGTTWNRVTNALVNNAGGLSFESVTMSQDGQRIAAVIQNGRLVYSNDGGTTWANATLPGATQTRPWRSIDSSADGSVIIAASQDGDVFLSTNAGTSWTLVPIAIGTPAVQQFENWYRVKTSADGNTIAIAGNAFGGAPGTGIYVSHDRGATWTRGFTLTADYTALAMSADGQTIGATVSNTGATTGRVLRSTDGGASFSAVTMPGTDTNWRAIAMSADANRLVAATGAFNTGTAGLLYTSQGNRTTVGTGGSISGTQGDSVQLQYVGNGQFSVQTSGGGTFTIR